MYLYLPGPPLRGVVTKQSADLIIMGLYKQLYYKATDKEIPMWLSND
jgi:hypothetical protein